MIRCYICWWRHGWRRWKNDYAKDEKDEEDDEEAPNEEVNDGKIACCHGKTYKMRGLNIHKYVRKKTNKYKMCS